MRRNLSFGLLVLVLRLGCGDLFGQATASATLEGIIYDKSQAVVVGAKITLTNRATAWSGATTSNDTGTYRFDLLPTGFYDIRVNAPGFAGASLENVELLVGKTTTLNFT